MKSLMAMAVMATTAILLSGCAQQATPSDAAIGETSLTRTLDAWKGGKLPEDLKNETPSIIVGDPAWAAGEKLLEFKRLGTPSNDGQNLHCSVKLTLQNKQGKKRDLTVTYVVGTNPVITVMRE